MIKQNQRTLNFILVLTDVFVIIISLFLAWFLRFKTTLFGPIGGHLGWAFYSLFLFLCIIPVYLFLYFSFDLYKSFRHKRTVFSEATQIIKVNIVAFIVLVAILFIINQPNFSRIMLLLLAVIGSVLGILERFILRLFLHKIRSQNKNLKHILIVGDNDLAYKFANKIDNNPYLGYHVVGFLGRHENIGKFIGSHRVLGSFNQLDKILSENEFDRVILAIPLQYYYKLMDLVQCCERFGIKVEIVPDYYRYIPARPSVDMIDDMPLINIRHIPLDDAYNHVIKKLSDIIISVIAIIITSPIMIVVAIIIKLTSKGPIIFKQERIGYNSKPFMMYKFRSMKVQNPDFEKVQWTTKDDPRKTKIGAFIRKTSIDELPQFFNVLKGDMSVVGPRPERPFFVDEFKDTIPKYMVKHQVRPGITGWAQIHGFRGNTSISKRIFYDIEYVENWHFGLDLGIMIKTVLKKNENAY